METFDCPPNTQCPPPGTTTTDYLGNFYYENGNLRAVYHPHGLIRPTPPSAENITDYVYDYYIKDYLGNVRVVLTEENATYETAMVATMEEYRAEWEEENFENIEEGREPVPYNYPVDASFPLNQYIAKVVADNDMTIGPSKVLEVSEGDKVQVATQYFFEENAPGATYEDLGFLIEEILVSMAAAGAGVLPVGEGALLNLINGNTSVGNEVFQFLSTKMDTTDMTRPHGYLVWLAYDKNFNLVPNGSGALRVTDPNELGTLFSGEIPIAKTGYLHVYVSNGTEAKTINFDNLYITTMQGKTRQINHYYPYGLRMRMGHGQRYTQMYTTKELQTGEYWDASVSTGLEMYDFEARFYDPQLGRWFVPDPAEQFANPYLAMGNNPVVYVDPDGEFVFVVVGALLGAYIGGTTANGGEFNPGKWDWNSGDTWAGILIGGGLGALGGWGATHAGPALANTGFFSNFGVSGGGTTAAYTITGGVAGGAIGYSSGFAGGMLHSNGNWEYGHQAGVFGAQIGSAVGSAIGAGYGLATGFDVNMPEYEAPADVEWNKSWRASSGNSGYGMSAFNSEIGILSDAPYSIDFTNSTDIQKMEHIIRSMRTSVHLGKDYMDFRQIFHNFPLYGGSQRFGGFTTILGSRMPMHMDLGIYSDMRMDLYRVGQFRYEGHGFFKDQFELSGVWQHFRYSKFGGNIPLLSIHWQSSSQDLLFNYIYR